MGGVSRKEKGGSKPAQGTRVCGTSTPNAIPLHVLFVGPHLAGKTELLLQLAGKPASRENLPTLGTELRAIKFVDYRGTTVKFHLWDTAGLEKYRLLSKDIAKSADAYLLCFDLSISQATNHVDTIQDLKQSYRDALGARATTQEISFFIGTKCDLAVDVVFNYWTSMGRIILGPLNFGRDRGDCHLAMLPRELIYRILFQYIELCTQTLGFSPGTYVSSLSELLTRPKTFSREKLESICKSEERPLFITSSKQKLGLDNLLYGVAQDCLARKQVSKGKSPLNFPEDMKCQQALRESPYCIMPK